MPAAYNEMALAMNNDLLKQIEINKKKTGFTVNETGEVSNEDLFPSIISKFRGLTLLVDFWATWCGPCRMQSPVLEALSDEVDNVEFVKMDVDENPETPAEFGIRAIPTLLVQKDGEVVERLTGFHTKDQLANVLAKYTK